MAQSKTGAYVGVSLLWIAYMAITFVTPLSDSSRQLGISAFSLNLLRLSIALPYLVIWLAATYAGLTLFASVRSMNEKEDALAYRGIGVGILVLLAGLVATTLIGSVRTYLQLSQTSPASITISIISNYIHIFGPLIGFAFILSGTRHLRRGTATAPSGLAALGTMALFLFSVAYVWLVFTNPTRSVSTDPKVAATYNLPDAAIVMTIIVPFLAACIIALFAILDLARYYRGVTGYLYKRSAMFFMQGLLFVILGSLMLQALLSLGSTRLVGLGLGGLLLIVYVFIGLQTLGYVFISLGAKKLSIIEKVMKKYDAGSAKGAASK